MPRYAAIDVGSNSIRMLAAEVLPGAPMRVLASDRQVTRLGESVFRNGFISGEAMELTCAVLARMAEQFRKLDVVGVRAVATAAVRDTRNQQDFLRRASECAGVPVEIISGREEARLIHLGVQSRWPQGDRRILIIDIGGGSMELIVSVDGRMQEAFSRPLGAVRLNEIFLRSDPPSPRELHQMHEFIDEKLAGALRAIRNGGWQRVVATSATASAVVCAIHRVPRGKRDDADRLRASARQVRDLYERLSSRNLAERRKVTGIGPRRAEIIVPGTGVLMHILEEFKLPSLYYSAAGVRDGIISDLAARGVGKELSQMSREQRREVEEMSRKFSVEPRHARKVAGLVSELFTGLQPLHQLPPHLGKLLEAAGFLHDVGHFISDSGHHKHSYYVVANSDMPGFTAREREMIANLCRYHRKALPAAEHSHFQSLPAEEKRTLQLLVPLLRIADNLDRGHVQRVESVECRFRDGDVVLQLEAQGDVDLEQWATERVADTFRQVYQRNLVVTRARK